MPNAKLCQLVMLIIVAGCAAQPSKDHGAATANAVERDVQCHSEHQTGTMLSNTVCTTQAQRDAQKAAAEDIRRSAAQGGGCRSVSGSGCQ
jgi:hypothetical protein